jgi:hypothetical protein
VPQPSERCLSRKAGIVWCCLKENALHLLSQICFFLFEKQKRRFFFETEIICTGACGLTGRSGCIHKPFLPKLLYHKTSGGLQHEP